MWFLGERSQYVLNVNNVCKKKLPTWVEPAGDRTTGRRYMHRVETFPVKGGTEKHRFVKKRIQEK